MKLVKTIHHEFEGFSPRHTGRCVIRIFERDDSTFIGVCSAVADNVGTSTTNRIEHIHAEISAALEKDAKASNPPSLLQKLHKFVNENSRTPAWAVVANAVLNGFTSLFQWQWNHPKKELLWVDHWPRGTGAFPHEANYSVVTFTEEYVPHWRHLSAERFEEETGIDVRLIEPLELLEG